MANEAGTINCSVAATPVVGDLRLRKDVEFGAREVPAIKSNQYSLIVKWNSMNIIGRSESIITVSFCFHRRQISVSIPSKKKVISNMSCQEMDKCFCWRPVFLRYRPGCGAALQCWEAKSLNIFCIILGTTNAVLVKPVHNYWASWCSLVFM